VIIDEKGTLKATEHDKYENIADSVKPPNHTKPPKLNKMR
jgi:hypothetical protein